MSPFNCSALSLSHFPPICLLQCAASNALFRVLKTRRGVAAPYSPTLSCQRRQARPSWNQVMHGCAKSLFLPGTSRVHFLSTETNLLASGEVSATISFFANEFKQSKSFFVIPRPAWACLLLTSIALSSLEAAQMKRKPITPVLWGGDLAGCSRVSRILTLGKPSGVST